MAELMDVKKKIINHAVKRINAVSPRDAVEVYLYTESLPESPDRSKMLNEPTKQALVFVDEAPQWNWGHPCKYMLYDLETGEMFDERQRRLPPAQFLLEPEKFELLTPKVPFPETSDKVEFRTPPELDKALRAVKGERYAILFSGMSNNRHLNDLEYLYRVLIDTYGFKAANITVLNYDGSVNYSGDPKPVGKWPGDNTKYRIKVNGKGGKTELLAALEAVGKQIKADDLLFIHTNNHGDGPTPSFPNKECELCCYPNWGSCTAAAFAGKLKKFPKFSTMAVMMEQCHSGGFSTPVLNNSTAKETYFCAACEADKSSMGGANFDPFAKEWIKKINDKVSVHDAFEYAKKHTDPYDTPNEADKPASCGNKIFLTKEKLNVKPVCGPWDFEGEGDPDAVFGRFKEGVQKLGGSIEGGSERGNFSMYDHSLAVDGSYSIKAVKSDEEKSTLTVNIWEKEAGVECGHVKSLIKVMI